MSRHTFNPWQFRKFQVVRKLGTSSSANVTKLLLIEDTSWNGHFFFKTHTNEMLSPLEGVMTLLSPGVGLHDVLMIKLDGQCGLATKDIKAHSIHDIFGCEEKKITFTALCKSPTESMLESFADVIFHTWFIGNDDCHASNLFFDFENQRFRVIDFDSLSLFKTMMIKTARTTDYSQPNWDTIDIQTTESLGTHSHPWPHYHPLHELSSTQLVTRAGNRFSQEMHLSFKQLASQQASRHFLTHKLLKAALHGFPDIKRWCELLGVNEAHTAVVSKFFEERLIHLRNAVQAAPRFNPLLLDGRLDTLRAGIDDDEPTYKVFRELMETQQANLGYKIIRYYINELIERLNQATIQQESLRTTLNEIAISLNTALTHNMHFDSLVPLIDRLCDSIPARTGLAIFQIETSTYDIERQHIVKLQKLLHKLSEFKLNRNDLKIDNSQLHLLDDYTPSAKRWSEALLLRRGYELLNSDGSDAEQLDMSVLGVGINPRPETKEAPDFVDSLKEALEPCTRQAAHS